MAHPKTLYEEDTAAWAENQATALRAAAHGGSNQELDWENLAEEIEDLSKSIKQAIHSHIRTIVEHLIKPENSPNRLNHNNWRQSVQNARVEIDALLEESPSLRPQIADFIRKEIPRGARLAIEAPEAHSELSDTLNGNLRAKSSDIFSFTPEQILGDWFPPEPQAAQRE